MMYNMSHKDISKYNRNNSINNYFIIEVIAIIVIIVNDIFVTTVVTDDDNVPVSQEPYEEPTDDPSGTSTPDVSRSHDPPPPVLQRAMAQLRPVSIPAVIKDIAGKFPAKTLRNFDEAILMCMGPSKLIRFGSYCISRPEFYIPVIIIIIIIVISVIITIY
jgi:hypothetical protein